MEITTRGAQNSQVSRKYKGILGKVSDVVKISNNLIAPLSICLREYSSYLIIDKLENAKKIIKSLDLYNMSDN